MLCTLLQPNLIGDIAMQLNNLIKAPQMQRALVTVAELIWFNSLWAATVLLGDTYPWLCWLLVAGRAAIGDDRLDQLRVAMLIAVSGIVFDMLLTANGWMVFDNSPALILPHWMFALWLGFGYLLPNGLSYTLTLNRGLRAGLYALVGAFNYWVASKLGAVIWPLPLWITCLVIGGVWATLATLWGAFGSMLVKENRS